MGKSLRSISPNGPVMSINATKPIERSWHVGIQAALATICVLASAALCPAQLAESDDNANRRLQTVFGENAYVRRYDDGTFRVQLNEEGNKCLAALARESPEVRKAVLELLIKDPSISAEGFKAVASLPNLLCVHMTDNDGWKGDFAVVLGGCKSLESLWVQEVGLTPSDVAAISKAGNLRTLMMGQNAIKTGSFGPLGRLTKLVTLDLSETGIEDEDLKVLRDMPNLKYLHLDHTKITNRGVGHIAACRKLEIMSLVGTKVTKAGADQLRKELPNLIFSWGDGDAQVLSTGKAVK